MYNSVQLIGRLVKDPEVRMTNTGKTVANFCIATDIVSSKDNKQTEFINIVAWNQLAEIVKQYVGKGKLVFVAGQMRSRTWEDKHQQKRKDWDVVIQTLKMLDKKDSGTGPSTQESNDADDMYKNYEPNAPYTPAQVNNAEVPVTDDEVPF
jgi:single-strand DNA-binding protein